MNRPGAFDRIKDNPFYVLGLRPDVERGAVEREGTKLLGLLELGVKSAQRYATPVGVFERDAEKVRHAMAELRAPERRGVHELWARLPPTSPTEEPATDDVDAAEDRPRWPAALADLGWGARR